jgi:ABC-type amino acid transport substrate-binding protein
MTQLTRSCGIALVAAASAALSACSTTEINADEPAVIADDGVLKVVVAPAAATFAELEASWAAGPAHPTGDQYTAFIDGEPWSPSFSTTVGLQDDARRSVGTHHVVIAAADGSSPVFAGDVDVAAGIVTRLYVFGDGGALQSRVCSYREIPGPKTLHMCAINLVRGGPPIEVVRCASPGHCKSISPPLPFGESFDSDLAADGTGDEYGLYEPVSPSGIAYRVVPSAALPDPPLAMASPASYFAPPGWDRGDTGLEPANLIAAPVCRAPSGDVTYSLQ